MNLMELGKEYEAQSSKVAAQAQRIKSRCCTAKGVELLKLRTESVHLEEIARDLKITGENLIHYYDKQ